MPDILAKLKDVIHEEISQTESSHLIERFAVFRNGFQYYEGRPCHTNQLNVRDRWLTTCSDGLLKRLHLSQVTFILTRSLYRFLSAPDHFQCPEIVQHRHSLPTEDFHPLLGEGFISIGEIIHHTNGTIGKSEGHRDIIPTIFCHIGQRMCRNAGRRCTCKEGDEINKVAALADDASPALDGIVHPMLGRDDNRRSPGNGRGTVLCGRLKNARVPPPAEQNDG